MSNLGNYFWNLEQKQNKNWNENLRKSAAGHQTPASVIVHAGSGGPNTLNLGPNEAFTITASDELFLNAAVGYGFAHVHARQAIIQVADKDLDITWGVDKDVIKDLVKSDRRLAGFTLLSKLAERVRAQFDGPIVCSFQSDRGVEYAPMGTPEEMAKNSTLIAGSYKEFGFEEKLPKECSCGCCDSRAQRAHLFCEAPGERQGLDRIGCIITDDQIEEIKKGGYERVSIEAHTECGGINGILNHMLKGAPLEDDLKAYLKQAEPALKELLAHISTQGSLLDADGKIKPEVSRAAEMWVAQDSAKRLGKAIGPEKVEVYLFDINKRKVFELNPNATVEQTWKNALNPNLMTDIAAASTPDHELVTESKGFGKREEVRKGIFAYFDTFQNKPASEAGAHTKNNHHGVPKVH